jgi:hypothetical protein
MTRKSTLAAYLGLTRSTPAPARRTQLLAGVCAVVVGLVVVGALFYLL